MKGGAFSTAFLVLGYGLSSSLLAIINKWAITEFPFPSLLTALQYVTATVTVVILGRASVIQVDKVTWQLLYKFLPAACVFYMAIFSNTKLLQHANVETFIVFRSSTPVLVAVADSLFLARPWPSVSTFGSLLVILAGTLGYVYSDSGLNLHAYSWAALYLATIVTEMVYIKHVVSSIGLSTWGLVLYNNLMSFCFAPVFLVVSGEGNSLMAAAKADDGSFSQRKLFPVVLSCIFGLLISFFGFACRRAVSATAFTVVGVTNKLLTILINVLMWDKHASPVGICWLLVCMLGGLLYQQSLAGKPAAKPVVEATPKRTAVPA